MHRVEKEKRSDLVDQITGGGKKKSENSGKRVGEKRKGGERLHNILNKRIPRCDTWIKYRPRYNISIMMIEGQRARSTAGQERRHEKERDGEMYRGEWRTREERPRVEDWTVPVRECWTYWAAYGPHRPLCPSIPPHPSITSVRTRPHPFTDYTSITPDNTWLPLNAMYRMTERCFAFFPTFRYECSGLVMKKRGERATRI